MVANETKYGVDSWVFYGYTPSPVLPIVCACLFAVVLLGHVIITTRKKCWRIMWAFNLGCLGEVVGYILRKYSALHPRGQDGLGLYIGQNLAIILAPACLAASCYMVFGRLITWAGPQYSPLRPTRVTRIFVTFDILSFVVQGAGGSLYSKNDPSLFTPAKAILVLGFLIQIISFAIFGILAFITQRRMKRANDLLKPVKYCLTTLYVGIGLVLIRNIFRTIEFADGNNTQGYFLTREAFYYGLETLPIFLCCCLFLVSHPSRYLPIDRFERRYPDSTIPNRNRNRRGQNEMVTVPQLEQQPGAGSYQETLEDKDSLPNRSSNKKWWQRGPGRRGSAIV